MSSDNDQLKSTMTRRTALKLLGGAAASLAGYDLLAGAVDRRPNIIFILSDDHRWDVMGCAGHPFVKTPAMDRLAKEGVMFRDSFVTTSLCSPSRATFLTGQYAHRHGVINNFTPWRSGNVTYLELMKKAGYDTALIGKWHMPGRGLPKLRGVDEFISFTAEGGQGVYFDCPLVVNGFETERKGKYITEDLTDYALRFIEKKRTAPFCLHLAHKAVHHRFQPPRHLEKIYGDADLGLPAESDPFVSFTDHHIKYQGLTGTLGKLYRNYCRTVTGLDEQIGRVLRKLDELGIAQNTIVIYTGDNGYLWGEHHEMDKRLAYEESIRVPFLIRYPGLIPDPGRVSSRTVLNLDVAPTILDLAGVPVPAWMQGRSLKRVLAAENTLWRDSWLYEHFTDYPFPVPGICAVRTGRYKYIEYQKGVRRPELFDIREDRREKKNLMSTARGKKLLPGLKEELARLKRETGYREM